jgi:hypothetical protein
MSQRHWIPHLFARSSRTPIVNRKPKSRPSFRPVLELLEDRLAPAVLTVNSLADSASNATQLTLREAVYLVNSGGNPIALGLPSLPAGWASQISGSFGDNDSIQFAPGLAIQDAGYGAGVISLGVVGDTSVGPSALAINPGTNVTIAGPSGNSGITIERALNAPPMRLFLVSSAIGSATSLTLENLTLKGGDAVGGKGGNYDDVDSGAGGGGGGAAGVGGAIFVERGSSLTILDSTLTGNTAQGGGGGTVEGIIKSRIGSGGGGLLSNGDYVSYSNSNQFGNVGGGPNGGLGFNRYDSFPGGNGGFGGGGGGGGSYIGYKHPRKDANGLLYRSYYGQPGGNGGFGGGGGGGGGGYDGNYNGLIMQSPYNTGGNGGYGGWGGGGGGGGQGAHNNGRYGIAGYGGGNGGSANNENAGGGGGGAGMGGAVYNDGGEITITNSTLTGNSAIGGAGGADRGLNGSGLGGAVFNDNGVLLVSYSTLDGNSADRGGAVFNIAHSGNTFVRLSDSILADTSRGNSDFWGVTFGGTATYVAMAANLIENNHGFAPPPGSPRLLTGVNPDLGPLADSGGPTFTMTPLQGSPVINQGFNFAGEPYDQRGLPREFNNVFDLGAVEINPATITGQHYQRRQHRSQ